MIRLISTLLILFSGITLSGQTIKTGVLVVGNTPGGIAAAIQSARSGAKTHLLIEGGTLNAQFTPTELPYILQIKNHFLLKDKKKSSLADTALSPGMSQAGLNALLKGILDTTKNLTLSLNAVLAKVEKDGKGWEIRLRNGQKLKSDILVDATPSLNIASMVKTDASKTVATATAGLFDTKLYRSALASGLIIDGDVKKPAIMPAGALIPIGTENFVIVPKSSATFEFASMALGKGAGIMAAYCAFFGTTTKAINIRIAQGELLAFGSTLIPLQDINESDPDKTAIQKIVLSGLLKPKGAEIKGTTVYQFDTAGTVSTDELRSPMKEIYSRSQLWFADNKKETMTLEDAISLLMFTAARGNELNKEIEEGWKESFNFNGKFDLKQPVTRKQFAVLADRYLQPFNVKVDYQGNLLS